MKRILTGDRPTGNLHLGHYVGTLKNRVKLQYEYDTYILIADVQCLTTNFDNPQKIKEDIYNVLSCYLAAGIDPEKSKIVIQSMIPEITELTIYYSMFVPISLLKYNPTIKSEMAQGYGKKELMYGFLGYPVNQAADISIFKANLVPVGKDQVPHVELTRKIVRRFNSLYNEVLIEPEALVGDVPTLPGLDGKDKMSKSLGNAIFLCDDDDSVVKKIKKAVTDPERIHLTDPGHPKVCTIFKYYQALFSDRAIEIEKDCQEAKFGCAQCKNWFTELLLDFIKPIREKYNQVRQNKDLLDKIALNGTEQARETASQTLKEVKQAMHLNYFS